MSTRHPSNEELVMKQESPFSLNPRVSVLRHNNAVYMFDPVTRTCASLNDAMLTILTNPSKANSLDDCRNTDSRNLPAVFEKLHSLGILIRPEDACNIEPPNCSHDFSSSLNRLHIFVTNKCNLRCVYCYA